MITAYDVNYMIKEYNNWNNYDNNGDIEVDDDSDISNTKVIMMMTMSLVRTK